MRKTVDSIFHKADIFSPPVVISRYRLCIRWKSLGAADSTLKLIKTLSNGLKNENLNTRIDLAHEGIGSEISGAYTFIVYPSKTTLAASGFTLTIPLSASIAFEAHSNVNKATIWTYY